MPKPASISISIGGLDISLDKESATADGVAASVNKSSKFLFEFNGNITDKFTVKKNLDSATNQYTTEIFLERGLGKDREVTPIVRITHFS